MFYNLYIKFFYGFLLLILPFQLLALEEIVKFKPESNQIQLLEQFNQDKAFMSVLSIEEQNQIILYLHNTFTYQIQTKMNSFEEHELKNKIEFIAQQTIAFNYFMFHVTNNQTLKKLLVQRMNLCLFVYKKEISPKIFLEKLSYTDELLKKLITKNEKTILFHTLSLQKIFVTINLLVENIYLDLSMPKINY